MSVEKLLVKLEANVKDYVRDMKKAKDSNDDLGDSSEGLKGKLGNVKQAMGVAAGAAAGFSAGVVALGSALTALTLNAADNRRELERMARQAKTSTGEFQALAFATKQYGVDADQVADITKDVSDRLGEFTRSGTGAFEDFADIMGMSKEQALETAEAFSEMSGTEAIQAMVSQMESAGATGDEITSVLESLGSELSRLYPLFRSNGEEMARVTGRFAALNDELSLSEEQSESLTQVAEDFDLMTAAISKSGTAISAKFAPALSSMLNTVTEVVPEATNSLISFFNAFSEAGELTNLQEIQRQIIDTRAAVLAYEDALDMVGENVPFVSDGIKEQIKKGNERIAQLQDQKGLIQDQTAEIRKQVEIKPSETGADKDGDDADTQTNLEKEQDAKAELEEKRRQQKLEREREAQEAELEMLRTFVLTKEELLADTHRKDLEMLQEAIDKGVISEEDAYDKRVEMANEYNQRLESLRAKQPEGAESDDELLTEQYENDLAMLQEFIDSGIVSEEEGNARKLEMAQEFILAKQELLAEAHISELEALQEQIDAGLISEQEAYEKRLEMAKKYNSDIAATKKFDVDITEKTEKKKEATLEDGLRTARMVGNALFEDNKLVKAGLVVADTAAGIMRTIATYGLPQATPFVTATAALGAAQLASIQSATKGGGTVSGGGAGGTSIQNRPEDFAPETTNLTIKSDIEGVGTSVNRVSLSVEDSDDFIEELADRINRKRG